MRFWILVFIPFYTQAQSVADNWYFGFNAGIQFQNNIPSAIFDGQTQGGEAHAAWSSAEGDLLFYTTNGNFSQGKVLDRNHDVMPNGNSIKLNGSMTQGSLICPHPNPDSSNLYYLFTISSLQALHFKLYYSVIDMSLNSGLGDVISSRKNIYLLDSVSERQTLVTRCDGDGFWLIIKTHIGNQMVSLPITSLGLDTNSMVFSSSSIPEIPSQGVIKASPSGKLLTCALFDNQIIELFEFDNSTGFASNPMIITIPPVEGAVNGKPYCIEYSPNSKYLYVNGYDLGLGFIYQFDLSILDTAIINSSVDTIAIHASIRYGLQMGPDQKIYSSGLDSIHVIKKPNLEGSLSDFELNTINLNPSIGNRFPQFPYKYLIQPIHKDTICLADTLELFFDDSCHISLLWNFDDPSSGNNTSTQNLGEHIFSDTGTYDVSLAVVYSADTHYYSNEIVVRSSVPTNPLPDSLINCNNQAIALDFSNPQFSFLWSTGSDSSGILLIDDQTLTISISGYCGSVSDSALVIIDTVPTVKLQSDSILCEGDSTSVNALLNTTSVFTNWSNGDTFGFDKSINHIGGADTIIWLSATNVCGEASDTVRIISVPQPDLSWFSDSILCEQNDLFIFEPNIDGQYHFMTLDSNALVSDSLSKPWQIEIPGNYYMTAFNVCDTIIKSAFLSPFQRIEVELGADTTICEGDSIFLDATWPNSSYAWSTGELDSSISVNNEGNYVVTITNTPCQLVEQRQVFFANPPCDSVNCKFSISNVFTPNADGVNDQLTIANNCKDLPYSVSIYNRWGQLVFRDESLTVDQSSSIKPSINWDGFVNGEAASAGVYFAVIEYNEGSQKSIRASITLLR